MGCGSSQPVQGDVYQSNSEGTAVSQASVTNNRQSDIAELKAKFQAEQLAMKLAIPAGVSTLQLALHHSVPPSRPLTPTRTSDERGGGNQASVSEQSVMADMYTQFYIPQDMKGPFANTADHVRAPPMFVELADAEGALEINTEALQNIAVGRSFTDEEVRALAGKMTRGIFDEGKCVYLQGDAADVCCLIVDGEVDLFHFDDSKSPFDIYKAVGGYVKAHTRAKIAMGFTDENEAGHQQFTSLEDLKAHLLAERSRPGSRRSSITADQDDADRIRKMNIKSARQQLKKKNLKKHLFCTKGTNSCIGGEIFYPDKTRRLCCITRRVTTVLSITAQALEELGQQFPKILELFKSITGAVMRAAFMDAKMLASESIRTSELLVFLLQYEYYEEGQLIFSEGDPVETQPILFVESGTISIFIGNHEQQKELVQLSSGSVIGEVSLLMDVRRTASCSTLTPTIFQALPRRSFSVFVRIAPSVIPFFKNQVSNFVLPLRNLIHNTTISEFFYQFCQTEFSSENIEFWMEINDYQTAFTLRTDEERATHFNFILSEFVFADAKRQVNLPAVIVDELKSITPAQIQLPVFINASGVILKLMAADSYPRFRKSAHFKDCLAALSDKYAIQKQTSVNKRVSALSLRKRYKGDGGSTDNSQVTSPALSRSISKNNSGLPPRLPKPHSTEESLSQLRRESI